MNLRASLEGSAHDPRQALRLRRFGIAAGSYALGILLIALGAWMGYAGPEVLATVVAIALVANAAFYVAFRSGLNLRAADPSLTAEQILAAIVCALYMYYHAAQVRGVVLMWVVVIFMFGLLRLSTRRLLQLAGITMFAYAGVIWLMQRNRPDAFDLRLELLQWAVLCGALVWFAFMGGYIRRLRTEVRRSEAFYRTMWETAADAGVIVGEDGRIQLANPAVAEVFGYAPRELVGREAWLLRAPQEREAASAGFRAYLATGVRGHDWRSTETRCLHRDGREFPAELSIGEMRFEGRRAFLYFMRDISERHAARQRIERLNAELEERVLSRTAELEALVKELETFTYTAAHDLRTPLGVMSTHAGMVLHEFGTALPEDGRRMLVRISENAMLMARLLEDLLTFARLGQAALRHETVDMQALAAEALAAAAGDDVRAARGASIGSMPACRADRALLRQAWVNLLSNALKYTRMRATQRVEAGYDTGKHAYFVRDNGIGFDMRYADKLFKVFERLHNDPAFEGNGAGLAIAARIVQRHGGRIWAEARPDEGATFYFTLR